MKAAVDEYESTDEPAADPNFNPILDSVQQSICGQLEAIRTDIGGQSATAVAQAIPGYMASTYKMRLNAVVPFLTELRREVCDVQE